MYIYYLFKQLLLCVNSTILRPNIVVLLIPRGPAIGKISIKLLTRCIYPHEIKIIIIIIFLYIRLNILYHPINLNIL